MIFGPRPDITALIDGAESARLVSFNDGYAAGLEVSMRDGRRYAVRLPEMDEGNLFAAVEILRSWAHE